MSPADFFGANMKKIGMTAAQYRALPKSKRHKYGAKRTVFDGLTFDSKAEAAQYAVLREQQPQITRLTIHPRFPLHKCGIRLGYYVADFSFTDADGKQRVQDVKGMILPLAKWKIAHFQAEYGIHVDIIRSTPSRKRSRA